MTTASHKETHTLALWIGIVVVALQSRLMTKRLQILNALTIVRETPAKNAETTGPGPVAATK